MLKKKLRWIMDVPSWSRYDMNKPAFCNLNLSKLGMV